MRAAISNANTIQNYLDPIAKEVNQNSDKRAHVKRDVKREARIFPVQQIGNDCQVSGATDGQKFSESLNNREDDRLV